MSTRKSGPREAITILNRQFMAVVAASLLAGGPTPANIRPLGMVTHAERARVGEAAVSAGSSLYEGDRLSTDTGGILRISSPAITLQLNEESMAIVRPTAGRQHRG
jgi:hypothetical protein